MKKLTNICGTFCIDNAGVLTDFACAPENRLPPISDDSPFLFPQTGPFATQKPRYLYETVLRRLIIPEGVQVIPSGFFSDMKISEELRLPESLEVLGTDSRGVFARCDLPDVVLPENVKTLSAFVFGRSHLRSLYLPENFRPRRVGREFKDGSVEILYFPKEYLQIVLQWFHDEILETKQMPGGKTLYRVRGRKEPLRGDFIACILYPNFQ